MQNTAKRQWGHKLSVKEAADISIDWCIKAREKNALIKKPPQIYYSYIVDGNINLNFFQNVSLAFRYSQKDLPIMDYIRDNLLRCLSVAIKAHYFLYANDSVLHEPYFFTIPSLDNIHEHSVGIIYKLEKENKAILVCDKKIDLLFVKNSFHHEFHSVVIEDSFRWFSIKNWSKIKNNSLDLPNFKKNIAIARDAKTIEELLVFGDVLEVPYEFKDTLKPLGIEWNKHIQKWFLPKGFDLDSVNEFLNHLKKTQPLKTS